MKELKSLGKMTGDDKKALVILMLMLFFLVTSSLHGLDMTLGFIAACILLYIPGINVGTEKNIKNISLGFPVVVASCMAIGTIGSEIGVGTWFSSLIAPFLQGQSGFTFVLFTLISGTIANILMTPMALVTILTGPFVDVAQNLGFSPEVVAYTLQHASCDVFFPYENNGTLMCFSFGMMSMGQFMKGSITRLIVDFIFVLTVGILWWTIIGLL